MTDNNFWEYLKEGFLSLIYPLSCENCGQPIRESKGYSICDDCLKLIKLISLPYCHRCGKPFSREVDFEEGALCSDCLNKKHYFYFVRSVASYQGVLRKCIHLLKYKKQVKLVKPLADLMIDYLSGCELINISEIDLIIPVPLFKDDYLKRGFNQSGLLAKQIADYFSVTFSEDLLIKKRANLSQVGLSKEERRNNVKNVYSINSARQEYNISSLLLIDDIFTTGSSIEACCKELRKIGVERLYVLTLARGV
ncbi:MAG: ComF family protein [Atribacterota bacterium]|jgi:ComF family protein|nr:ComF family protein [Atribacterota bacterium]